MNNKRKRNTLNKHWFILIAPFMAASISAQVDEPYFAYEESYASNYHEEYANFETNFSYEDHSYKERKVVAPSSLREADVKFSRRVHQIIDTRQKINHCMTWKRRSFSQILWENLVNGNLTAFKTDQLLDSVQYGGVEELQKTLGGKEVIMVIDTALSTATNPVPVPLEIDKPFYPESINKFRIMEEWIFDAQRSVFEPRIIAIAIMAKPFLAGGIQDENEYPMVWLSMEQLRPILIRCEVFNRQNGASRLTYDDFFQLRLFQSYVVKESNEFDADINQLPEYKDNSVDALLESDKIKNDLFIFEHDLWNF